MPPFYDILCDTCGGLSSKPQKRNIEGINKNGKEIKVFAFTDDITLYIGNNNSLKHLENQLAYLEHYAGVKYNRDKCLECGSELIKANKTNYAALNGIPKG